MHSFPKIPQLGRQLLRRTKGHDGKHIPSLSKLEVQTAGTVTVICFLVGSSDHSTRHHIPGHPNFHVKYMRG
jgi:hypothetical protein